MTAEARRQFDKWRSINFTLFQRWSEDELDAWWLEITTEERFQHPAGVRFPSKDQWSRMPREAKQQMCANLAAIRDVEKMK